MHLDGVLIEHAIYGIDAVAPDSLEVVNSTLASNENVALSLSGIGSNSVGFFQHDSVEVPNGAVGVDLYGNMSGLTLDQNKFAGASSSVAGIQSTDPWTSGSPTITANTFSGFTNGSCIDIGAGTFTFTNNVLADSKYGFLVTGGTVAIGTTSSSSDNTITGMTQGIRCDGVGTTTVRNNQITGNSVGVYALNLGLPDLGNSGEDGKNSIYNNTSYCVRNRNTAWLQANGNWWGSCQAPTCTAGNVLTGGWLCSQPAGIEVAISRLDEKANAVRLLAVRPNPTLGMSTIALELVGGGGTADVAIYDVAGRVVRRFGTMELPQGLQEVRWNGRDEAGRQVGSGIYFVQVVVNHSLRSTGKVLVVR